MVDQFLFRKKVTYKTLLIMENEKWLILIIAFSNPKIITL